MAIPASYVDEPDDDDDQVAPGSAREYACTLQVELRTPPRDWGSVTPSPRMFGLSAARWQPVYYARQAKNDRVEIRFERLKEFG